MARKTGRAFGQDIGHGEGGIEPNKGPMKRGKGAGRAFATAAAVGGGAMASQAVAKHARPSAGGAGTGAWKTPGHGHADPKYGSGPATTAGAGVMGQPETVRDMRFYGKKRAVEAVLGREVTMDEFLRDHYVADDAATAMGTSIFDPVLCELAYRWFCPPGGAILDPFAGGSVRGVVAGMLGRRYIGCELRMEQVHANRVQAELIFEDRPDVIKPMWCAGDSAVTLSRADDPSWWFNQAAENCRDVKEGAEFDFVFSCPPYADLEVYSNDPADLSTMAYDDFRRVYTDIIVKACARLRSDRFACFVVGDVRGPDGAFRSFPQHTIEAFAAAGLKLYNDAILVTAAGSLPVRAGRQFQASRKLGTTHQRILVFVKGDGAKATSAIGLVDFGATDALEGAEQTPAPAEAYVPSIEPDPSPTPCEELHDERLDIDLWLKRDDLFGVAGVQGGKVRSCWSLATAGDPPAGLVTAGSRSSPQINIVAHIARELGVPCRAHAPEGDLGPELLAAQAAGAEIVQHKAGYNTVIVSRAKADAVERGWREIPFGMECWDAVEATASQVAGLPWGSFDRIVIPVGSGMSLAGVLWGLEAALMERTIPVLGVVVGADPVKRLERYAPAGWRQMVDLVPAGVDYHKHAAHTTVAGVALDPIYEGKCVPFLKERDLFWLVGIRETA